ncbi:hypothetical protein DB30_03434 [Enhygromyxa salina]|uniref:Uncharacterized protein n=1 Tax=Enhygromyxa salina TaxID=215803 RepID=A0A0C2CJX7_9BACT|nr:hypothetical protein DB30_03434 [Enhygromyxa salina]
MAKVADHGGQRGAQQHERERLVGARLLERVDAMDLGAEHRGGALGIAADDQRVVDHTRRVDHCVDRPKPGHGRGDEGLRVGRLADVGADVDRLRTQLLELLHERVEAGICGSPRAEHQRGPACRERAGKQPAESPGRAGHDHAALPQVQLLGAGRGLERGIDPAQHRAGPCVQPHELAGARLRELGVELGPRWPGVDLEHRERQAGELDGQGRRERPHGVRLGVATRELDVQQSRVSLGVRLPQPLNEGEQPPVERLRIDPRVDVNDRLGDDAPALELAEQLAQIRGRVGRDAEVLIAQVREPSARRDDDRARPNLRRDLWGRVQEQQGAVRRRARGAWWGRAPLGLHVARPGGDGRRLGSGLGSGLGWGRAGRARQPAMVVDQPT